MWLQKSRLEKRFCSFECYRASRKAAAMDSSESRIKGKFVIDSLSGCWNWSSYTDAKGYGDVQFRGRVHKAHRVSYLIHKGEIPVGLLVRHRCDNPRCINPDHLEVGTPADNSRDMVERGRVNRSEQKRQRVSAAKMGHEVSPETRRKISESLKGREGARAKAVRVDGVVYRSILAAGVALGCSDSLIRKWVKSGRAQIVQPA